MIEDAGLAVIHGLLYLIAFFWIFGFIPIQTHLGLTTDRQYDRRKDVAFSAAFLMWMFAGYALFRWIIPAPLNPFFE